MADPKKINYAGGQTIDNSELVDQKIADLNTAILAITGTLTSLNTADKSNIVSALNEVLSKIPDEIIVDGSLDTSSANPVQNKVITNTINKIQDAIEDITTDLDKLKPMDDEPVKDSEKPVKSGGIYDAIRFASVKVGETMFWPVSDTEIREVHSDNPFNFEVNGTLHSVTTVDDNINMCISKDEPEGWWPLNGKAELKCSDYPELAKFFGGTQNDDGTWNNDGNNVANDWVKIDETHSKSLNARIWLPYVQQKIIKAKY